MRKVVLGRSGLEVSAVGFGGIPIMRVETAQAVRTIRRAMDLGINFLDTAAVYSDSQIKIGLAVKGRRDGLVLASKSSRRDAEGLTADLDRARREMGADCLDLYQLHNVSSEQDWRQVSSPGGAVEGLLAARQAGKIRHIGVTSHKLDLALKLIDEPVFETVQFPFNLVTSEPADQLIPKARLNNVGFIAMKPLCGGQYDNADLAFKFLNAWPDVVPIPGIEAPAEIEQIVAVVESGATLTGPEKAQAQAIADSLGKLFCRRCGYCQPCPQGVPLTLAMVFDSFVKRFDHDRLAEVAGQVASGGAQCTECGLCRTKCPYDLPIIETVKKATAKAKEVLKGK